MSERSVALLRGVNVAGRRRVTMAQLLAVCAEAGLVDASTYLQSGNVVFSHPPGTGETLGATLGTRLAVDVVPGVVVVVRSASELAGVVAGQPFGDARDPAHLHVTFLATSPEAARVAALGPVVRDGDGFALRGRDVYLHCPNGYGRTTFNNAFFERRLKVDATTRNWKTVTALAALCAG